MAVSRRSDAPKTKASPACGSSTALCWVCPGGHRPAATMPTRVSQKEVTSAGARVECQKDMSGPGCIDRRPGDLPGRWRPRAATAGPLTRRRRASLTVMVIWSAWPGEWSPTRTDLDASRTLGPLRWSGSVTACLDVAGPQPFVGERQHHVCRCPWYRTNRWVGFIGLLMKDDDQVGKSASRCGRRQVPRRGDRLPRRPHRRPLRRRHCR